MKNYERIRTLGKGGYGEAILAKRKDDKSLVVVKEVRLTQLKPADREAAFQEAKVLASLQHPFIVSYVDNFVENNYLYIVMEYADGGDLAGKISRQSKPFSEQEVLQQFIQIALAIKHIHDKKILHRDLKTQNIFLTKDGTIKLGDFGIARVLQHTFQLCKTRIGTPYYLSPEICEGKSYNAKTDIWSLGCILYELCTLKHAFDGANMNSLLMNIIRGRVAPIPSSFSPELRNLVEMLLKKDPEQRPSINQILQMPIIKDRLSDFLSDRLVTYDQQSSGTGKQVFTNDLISKKRDEEAVRRQQKQMMYEAQRRQREAEERRRIAAEQKRQRELYERQRQEVLENKKRAQMDLWGHNPALDFNQGCAEPPRPQKKNTEIDADERRRVYLEMQREAQRNRERIKELEEAQLPKPVRTPPTAHKVQKKHVHESENQSILDIQKQQRLEAKRNREKQMAAVQGIDMNQLLAEAEAEARAEQKRIKEEKLRQKSQEVIDMDKLLAEAEAEIRNKEKEQINNKQIDDVYEQANAILEALEIHNSDSLDSPETSEPTNTFYIDEVELNLPEGKDSDSLMYRAEAIRSTLEKALGFDRLITLYNLVTDEDAKCEDVEVALSEIEPGYVMLLQQLLVLDDKLNS